MGSRSRMPSSLWERSWASLPMSQRRPMRQQKEEQQIWQQLVQRENQKLKTDDLKVYIAAHSYVLEDPYIGKPIRDFLNSNGVQYISGYVTDRELALRNSTAFSQTCKWEMSRELLGNLALKRRTSMALS